VFDATREQEILNRVAAKTKGPLSSDSIRSIFKTIMEETRKVED
jgi:chorismate mutase